MAQEDVPPLCPRQRQPPSPHPQAAAPLWELGIQLHVRTPQVVSPCASGNSRDTSVPAVHPSVAWDPAPAPLGRVQEPLEDTDLHRRPWTRGCAWTSARPVESSSTGLEGKARLGPLESVNGTLTLPETFLSHSDTGQCQASPSGPVVSPTGKARAREWHQRPSTVGCCRRGPLPSPREKQPL